MSLVSDMYHFLESTHTYLYEMVYMKSVEGIKKGFSLLLPCMNSWMQLQSILLNVITESVILSPVCKKKKKENTPEFLHI